MDAIGGNNGVEISGNVGSDQILILPHASGIWGAVVHTVEDVTRILALANPAVFTATIGIGLLGHFVGAARGEVHCDENAAGSEETFGCITTTGGFVEIISFNGYFTADSDDRLVYANRGQAQRDEKFRLIHNANGTVSFQSRMGTYICADRNRGNKRVSVDRNAIGEWEQWTIVPVGNGKIALRESQGQYASVAP